MSPSEIISNMTQFFAAILGLAIHIAGLIAMGEDYGLSLLWWYGFSLSLIGIILLPVNRYWWRRHEKNT